MVNHQVWLGAMLNSSGPTQSDPMSMRTHLLDVTSQRFPHHLHLLGHRHNANTLDVLFQQVKPNPHSTGKITTLPHAKCYLPWCSRRLSRACPSLLGDKHPWPSGPIPCNNPQHLLNPSSPPHWDPMSMEHTCLLRQHCTGFHSISHTTVSTTSGCI